MCSRAEGSLGTAKSYRSPGKAGFEEWRLLLELPLFGASGFGLEPVHIEVFSPSGAFHVCKLGFMAGQSGSDSSQGKKWEAWHFPTAPWFPFKDLSLCRHVQALGVAGLIHTLLC